MAQSQQSSMQQIIQNNLLMRNAIFSSCPLIRKNLGIQSGGGLGGTLRQKIYNAGLTTRFIIQIKTQVDIGTATATLSPKAPFNLINRIRFTDYDGVDRINISGSQLFLMNCVRRGTYYGYNNESATAVISNPLTPTAVGTAQQLSFFLEIPLAFDPSNDLRGALLTQTGLGECTINVDFNTSLYTSLNADSVYNGAPTSTVVLTSGYAPQISMNTWQEFYQLQSIQGVVPIPQLDVLTVYELSGNIKSSDNISVNTEKLINFPNVRSVIGTYFEYVNNGIMNAGTDLSQIRVIANGNTILYDNSNEGHLFEQRVFFNSDIRNSMYIYLARKKAIETSLLGNVQLGITPSAVTAGNTHIDYAFESFYTKGMSLPGMSQSSG